MSDWVDMIMSALQTDAGGWPLLAMVALWGIGIVLFCADMTERWNARRRQANDLALQLGQRQARALRRQKGPDASMSSLSKFQ